MKRFIKSSIVLSLLSISSLAFAQPVVLINTFSVDASKHEETLAYWESARGRVGPTTRLYLYDVTSRVKHRRHLPLRKRRELGKPKALHRCHLCNEGGATCS